jgi:endonuclease/exonuclease/phosphatase (EEP) superfamily protein YafD
LAAVRRLKLVAGISIAAAALNLALLIGVGGFALPQAALADARLLRVVSANVHGSMATIEAVAERARSYGADVVSIYEAPDELREADLARLFPELSHRSLPSERLEGPKWKRKRRSLLAAREAGPIDVTGFMGSHGVILRTQVDGVQIVTTHPPSPGAPGERWDRDRQLATIKDGLDSGLPFVVMGDFNTTPWGHAYASVPGERAGDPRFEGTFPSFAGVLGLPIDHIRFGGGLTLTEYHVGASIGSDHLPLFATFAFPRR